MTTPITHDVVIIGTGLAGLSLARHLQLAANKRILLLDKRADLPPTRQKVGESLVQVGGYYFAKVLDMEEHLLHDQFMKYNLRFYWKNAGSTNQQFEDYSQAYIRAFSNIPCYQLDRNTFEAELLRSVRGDSRFTLAAPVADLHVELSDDGGPHKVSFTRDGLKHDIQTEWVVDTTGRGRMLARQFETCEASPIRHGASFMWVDGLVDIEKLTDQSLTEIRRNSNRRATGHLPQWLATNHFMGKGFWFWVIPLRGKTSLGLVYDRNVISHKDVSTAEQLRAWACREFPLFARDLPQRRIVDFSAYKDFAHGCRETINPARWAMSGEAGRFTDPLYSPGSDFIALHNTLIVDAILTDDPRELKRKCWLYEMLMESMYNSLLPTYAASYDVLGDQEAFVLKYTWELSVYFSFFVFPFINELATDAEFVPAFLSRFSRLGDMNAKVQQFLSGFYQWKKDHGVRPQGPVFHDFMQLEPLKRAEQTFYQVGVTGDEAKEVLDDQLVNLKEMAKFLVAHVYSVVLGDERVLTNGSFVESIDLKHLMFDPARMQANYAVHRDSDQMHAWNLNPHALRAFRASDGGVAETTGVGEEVCLSARPTARV
ncbi:MAG TPA: NAD(P)-binding protein [Pirellulaceae bacterium]|nr:NAD(P)-binding protein [Pirellulaceae bacterium]